MGLRLGFGFVLGLGLRLMTAKVGVTVGVRVWVRGAPRAGSA